MPVYAYVLIAIAALIGIIILIIIFKSHHYIVHIGDPFVPVSPIKEFPKNEHEHVVPSKHGRDVDYVSKDFKFRPKNLSFILLRILLRIAILFIVTPMVFIRFGLIVKNRHVFFRHRKELKNGYITIANHVFPWDYLTILAGRFGHFPEFPMWQEGFESTNGKLFQLAGGFPVPLSTFGLVKSYQTMKEVLQEKKWLHVYPEAACWYFYEPIREFKPGTFRLAYECDVPIFPIGISYRRPHGLFKLYKRHEPLVTVSFGEPIYADKTLLINESLTTLSKELHLAVVHLSGIKNEMENEKLKTLYHYRNS